MHTEISLFRPDFTDLTAENLEKFTKQFLAGEVPLNLLTEEIPEDWDKEPVKVHHNVVNLIRPR